MRLSYSQLEWFLRCPYIYKYQFIDKNPIPRGKDAAFGGLLHAVLEELYKQKPIIPTLTEILEFYEKRWQRGALDSSFGSEIDAKIHFKEGMRIIKDYYAANDIGAAKILRLEQFFEVPIKDPQSSEVHVLAGRIDRIDKTPEGIEIIDYKTNKSLRTEEQIAHDLQLSLYHLGVTHLWPEMVAKYGNRVRVSLYFLRHGEKIGVQKAPEELEETKRVVLQYIREIQQAIENNTFEPRPSTLCAMEPYCRICPFFRDRYREKKPKIREHEVAQVVGEYHSLKEQERQIKVQIAQLNEMIHDYLDEQELEGIYNGELGVLRTHTHGYEIDTLLLKEVLEELGKWEDVLEVSKSKLKKVASELPAEYREKIKKAQKVKGVSKSLRVKRL